jgi:superfamily I DNA/RNA helicase/RecB family exonuclease
MSAPAPAYRLVRTPPPPVLVPRLDPSQQAVVDHRGGPLRVLAGPGTGKTTTLVEAVVDRVAGGLRPEQVLVLTFSRRAATELRERITARLGTTVATPSAWTFHAFCYALLRSRRVDGADVRPLRLLSGPEQDVVIRDMLAGSSELRRTPWPVALQVALRTRGFAEEVRSVLSRAREVGLDPAGLAALAADRERPDWAAVAGFYGDYLDILDSLGAVDYPELVRRAAAIAGGPAGAQLRAAYRVVFVDEYQDTDPAQELLLQGLAGGGGELMVVGDPDQSIYAFRGAEVRGLLDFPDRFPTRDGSPAPTLTLGTSRRAGPALLAVSRRVADGMPLTGVGGATLRAHRALSSAAGLPPGEVSAATYSSVGAEAAAIANLLRRAHLEFGLPWSAMAVLVRSGVRSIPLLRRMLGAAGVPVEVAGDELPLAREPAVAPLLLALRCAEDPGELTAERARVLLLSPLVGADPTALRRLGRELRAEERVVNLRSDRAAALPRPSAELIRAAVVDPGRLLASVRPDIGAPATELSRLLQRAGRALRRPGDGGPELALWELWHRSPWPAGLAEASASGGAAGRAADRDLDAVVALFSAVARAEEQRPRPGVRTLLDELAAQQIPGDTLAERAARSDAVRVLTAHRAKGLEWDLVVVAGVQEAVWPDLRQRSSLLQADRLDVDGVREPLDATALLAEERRLFYVAVTRARQRLVVTAVSSAEEDGERPSRFLAELGVPIEAVGEQRSRPLSLPALVAELRALAVDPDRSPPQRRAAAQRLARLAAERRSDGAPRVPQADPATWWGMRPLSDPDRPLYEPGEAVPLSGTSLTGLDRCPLRWFLEHEAQAKSAPSTAMGFGGVVHALADEVGRRRTPADVDALMVRLDRVWDQLAYEAGWLADQQYEQARAALRRFVHWHVSARDRTLAATEEPFDVVCELPSGRVRLRGKVDRLEIDRDGSVRIIDLKTGRAAVPKNKVPEHPQLGVYQLAAQRGAFDQVPALDQPARRVGGAELVHLRVDDHAGPKVQAQPALEPADGSADGSTWIEGLLDAALSRVLAEQFHPTPGDHCGSCSFRTSCPAQPEGRQVVQ